MLKQGEDYNFVARTQENLQMITDSLRGKPSVLSKDKFNDVTNLINNCLGLLSVVYEKCAETYSSISNPQTRSRKVMNDLQSLLQSLNYSEEKYGTIIRSESYDANNPNDHCSDMPTLLRHMRNAICHNDIEPHVNSIEEIDAVVFRNHRNANKVFEMRMTIEQIFAFAYDIANAYINSKQ